MKHAVVAIVVATVCAGAAGAQSVAGPTGTWVGTLSFRAPAGAEPLPVSIELRGGRAVVALGAGHAARTQVAARIARGRVRISLPGRPARLVLDGRVERRRLTGTVRQGSVRGRFSLRRGRPLEGSSLGLYRFADGRPLGSWSTHGVRVGSLYDDGEIRGQYLSAPNTYAVGAGLQTRNPVAGMARFAPGHVVWRGARADRVPIRQEEVFVRSGAALLGCTLSVPAGAGRRPGVVFAHGSGPAPRSENSVDVLYFNHLGLAVLSCDKRGVGQSGGSYPGGFPSAGVVDQYARDVEAQARFLARQAEIDRPASGSPA